MKHLVAVSGGVDSVVLLDRLVKEGAHELVVAHFDHGIREDSADDARFVKGLAQRYALPFTSRREELGPGASEDLARSRRYAFLREEAKKHDAMAVTAHHADDVVETIAINLIRGTGWRGLAVLGAPDVARPLLDMTKRDIRQYALENRLEWVEDGTNATDVYLRNRVRQKIATNVSVECRRELLALRDKQLSQKKMIDQEMGAYLRKDGEYSRYFFSLIPVDVASELLRSAVAAQGGEAPTRPQSERAIMAIKTARPGSVFQIGGGQTLRFSARTFIVETP